jgi:tetratricopeptide (TPR) repeat protein
MGKDTEATAQDQITKAEQLFRAKLYKKAGKTYHKAGNIYLKLNKFESAKNCFLKAMSSFLELERFDTVLELLRQAGEACLQNNQYLEANQLYKDAPEYILKLRNQGDINQNLVLFSVLSYFCLHVKGSPEDGLEYIKRNRSKIDNEIFKENNLIQMVSELTLSLREKTTKYFEKIQDTIMKLKLREPEVKIIKLVLLLTKAQILLESSLKVDKETYTTNDVINLTLELNIKPLIQLVEDSFYNFQIKSLKISKIVVNLSDNLTTQSKPELPLSITSENIAILPFTIKPHFQIDTSKIGPILLTIEINDLFLFNYETHTMTPNLTSPPAALLASIKNLRPPLLEQTFPLEVLVENRSEAEALDVNLQLEFPEELKIMRGTTDKQIYSLRINETIKWELNLKPLEIGDYIIKMYMKFKDPDDNLIEEIKEFPFSIKM